MHPNESFFTSCVETQTKFYWTKKAASVEGICSVGRGNSVYPDC